MAMDGGGQQHHEHQAGQDQADPSFHKHFSCFQSDFHLLLEAVPPLGHGFLYCAMGPVWAADHLGRSKKSAWLSNRGIDLLQSYRRHIVKRMAETGKFQLPQSIRHMAKKAESVLSCGNDNGEGWFLTAEMIELIESGVPNIICAQPFACLPNHVTGKGMIKEFRRQFPQANIVAVDYDPGASEVNQLNRIKLMMAVAFENLKKDEEFDKIKPKKKKAEKVKA